MSSEKLEQGWIKVRLDDSKNADLICLRDEKGNIVRISDYQGNELEFNAGGRYVMWQGKRWKY